MTKLFTRSESSTRPLVSAEDLDLILNAVKDAVLLVDKKSQQIVSANSKALELTAYTLDELISKNLKEIIDVDFDDLLAMRSVRDSGNHSGIGLSTRSNLILDVSISIEALGEDTPWALVIIEEIKKRKKKQASIALIEDLLNEKLVALISTMHNNDPEVALRDVLNIGETLLPESSLAIYVGKGGEPIVELIEAVGPDIGILPADISPPDLNHLLKSSIWKQGQRAIITLLHQSARAAGLNYLASAPINDVQEQNAWLGLIVACGRISAHDYTLSLLEVLASGIATIIHKNLLIKNLKRSITKSKERLSAWDAVQKNVKDGIITISPSMNVESINPAAEMILGYANKEIKNQPIENIIIGTNRLHPAISSALQGISTPTLGTVYLHRRDGSSFPAEIEINPIRNEDAVIGSLVFIRDLSENEQIRTKTQQLEQRALLGEVTAIFAHEVRNPINNISLGLQLLARNLTDNDPEKERIMHMLDDCNRLTSLMDSVLTFSRTGNYVFAQINIVSLLQRILKRWHPRFTNTNIDYNFQAQDDLPPIFGDLRSLEQVFTNIISNAVHAMQDSGGVFSVKINEKTTNGNKSVLQIDLSDTGPGIPEEIQERIFEPFFTTNTNGTGLGLSITKQIIIAHRGTISLTSFPGGTSFHIQLPITAPSKDPN